MRVSTVVDISANAAGQIRQRPDSRVLTRPCNQFVVHKIKIKIHTIRNDTVGVAFP